MICQGNGAGPAFWLCISAILVYLLYKNGHMAKFCTALSMALIIFAAFLFIDDTDLVMVELDNESLAHVVERMQQAVTCWNGALHASSSALKPIKCSWGFLSCGIMENGNFCHKTNFPHKSVYQAQMGISWSSNKMSHPRQSSWLVFSRCQMVTWMHNEKIWWNVQQNGVP